MTRALLLTLALACAPAPAFAQAISGPARAVDGDTLDMTGFRVRLFGVDAVELGQTCERGGQAWRCGEDARAQLAALVAGRTIACETRDTDAYGRMVAVCEVDGTDLSQAMAWSGYAVALTQFSEDYVVAVDSARKRTAGIWGSVFVEPAAYRAAHPQAARSTGAGARSGGGAAAPVARAAPAGAYYRNCAAAWAAGAAPLTRGQPGYRPEMDGDHDGVACEPYRGRR